jgi:flagellar biosynthesis/type III secretory pathway protein FliH
VVASLKNLAADQEQLFEPLKRLALHLAEQLVRAELSISGAAIEQLVRQCLAQLDQPADKAVVCLNPDDLERFTRLTDGTHGLRLEADARLQAGSVRVEINDSLIEDLIEHRLEVLSRQLLGDAHARLKSTSFETGKAKVEDAGQSTWPSSNADDVTDLPYRNADEHEHSDDPTTGSGD